MQPRHLMAPRSPLAFLPGVLLLLQRYRAYREIRLIIGRYCFSVDFAILLLADGDI